MSTAEQIMRELQKLPEPLAQEVLDFIGYIELKHGQSGPSRPLPVQSREMLPGLTFHCPRRPLVICSCERDGGHHSL
jgi:hypothetical protein